VDRLAEGVDRLEQQTAQAGVVHAEIVAALADLHRRVAKIAEYIKESSRQRSRFLPSISGLISGGIAALVVQLAFLLLGG
jgi:hypothetical protein